MNRKKDIIETIYKISGGYAPYKVFTDWIKCASISIENGLHPFFHDETWEKREHEFISTMKQYPKEKRMEIVGMTEMLVESMETEMTDFLGEIYMESGMGSKVTGQFFTPFHLSMLTAKTAMKDLLWDYDGKQKITLNEPSVGGGGLVIAAAKVLKEAGYNYQKCLDVVAQDMDWNGVYMCYLQLSLYGISATVVQGDTLANPYNPADCDPSRVLKTPAKVGALI